MNLATAYLLNSQLFVTVEDLVHTLYYPELVTPDIIIARDIKSTQRFTKSKMTS